MAVPDRELEFSPLSGRVTRDGVTVQVHIYRFTGTNEGWTLEVADHEDGSTVWEGTFDTDDEAYEAFERCIREDGIRTFSEDAPTWH
ncbi:KTSC domain-containing protein [Methylorubrum aminovorans]